jgi:hypothetical protein
MINSSSHLIRLLFCGGKDLSQLSCPKSQPNPAQHYFCFQIFSRDLELGLANMYAGHAIFYLDIFLAPMLFFLTPHFSFFYHCPFLTSLIDC